MTKGRGKEHKNQHQQTDAIVTKENAARVESSNQPKDNDIFFAIKMEERT